MRAEPTIDPLARRGRSLATLFGIIFWGGALWLFAEAYVPLKQLGAALAGQPDAFESAGRGMLQVLGQTLPAIVLLLAVGSARRLFQAFGSGEILVAANGKKLGEIGSALAAAAVLMLLGIGGEGGEGWPFTSLIIVLGSVGLAVRWIGEAWERAAATQAELDSFV
jgi:hypothetical protein